MGSEPRSAVLSSPAASRAFEGRTTCRPGQEQKIDSADWLKFRANYFSEFPTLSDAESSSLGDIDLDGDVDFDDFRLFKIDYIDNNGIAAFQALSPAVPEPSSLALAAMLGLALPKLRRRRRQSRQAL